MINRSITTAAREFLQDKILLITGPRQVGKTWFSKTLFSRFTYLNFDDPKHRKIIMGREWPRDAPLLILDELHKMKNWKRFLKGVFDTEVTSPPILVTGSARMDTFRKGGESLAGRHHLIHLLPLSVKEVDPSGGQADQIFKQMLALGSFPEPFLKGSERAARLWRKSHLDVVIRQDLLDLENVRDIKSIEMLVDLLADRVGSTVSYSSLARVLEVSPHTVKHWIQILESLYVVFVVTPYAVRPGKSLLKEPKIYFYDTGRVTEEGGARVENLVANHLLKRARFLEDTEGERVSLHYVRDKEKREVDFLTVRNRKPEWLIEVKTADTEVSGPLRYYHERLAPRRSLQLTLNLRQERCLPNGPEVIRVAEFLSGLET